MVERFFMRVLFIGCVHLAFVGVLLSQVSLDTAPVSWSVNAGNEGPLVFLSTGNVDTDGLLLEDAEEELTARSGSMRFAVRKAVDYTPDNSGRWINLPNGDRIWLLGIQSEGARSLGLTFGRFSIPKGAAVYLYDEDRTTVIGALTSVNNHPSKVLTTDKIPGDRLIVEYYEPFSVRHQGDLRIRTVAHTYRDLEAAVIDDFCGIPTGCPEVSAYRQSSAAVVLLALEDGTRYATGTIVNNSNFDGKPYIVTSSNVLQGDPNAWHFTFRRSSLNCEFETSRKFYSTSGAAVRVNDPVSGLALLELHTRPLSSWRVYYAGWDASGATPQHAAVIHHPYGGIKQIAFAAQAPTPIEWNAHMAFRVDGYAPGSTAEASAGAPLINGQFQLTGVMVSGFSECGNPYADFFAPLKNAWSLFQPFLDPFNQTVTVLTGTYLNFGHLDANPTADELVLFPVPARNTLNLVNNGEEAIVGVLIYDLSGRIVSTSRFDGSQLSISELPVGQYVIEAIRERSVIRKTFMKWD